MFGRPAPNAGQDLDLSVNVGLHVDAKVVAVGDGGRLEDQPELRLLHVPDRQRRLLAHEPCEARDLRVRVGDGLATDGSCGISEWDGENENEWVWGLLHAVGRP